MPFDITSPQNERIKHLVRLKDRTYRDKEGLYVVEGERLVSRALAAGLEPVEVYVDGSVRIAANVQQITVEPSVLDKASYRKRSEGLIAVFEQRESHLEDLPLQHNPLIIAAESVEKPGNLGAILRTADAAGADTVVGLAGSTDMFNPNLIRASTGAVFHVPFTTTSLGRLVSFCRSRSIEILVADPGAPESVYQLELSGPVCLMVGAEDVGLSPEALSAADRTFSIPMMGTVDSLNVSATVAIGLYEAVRQRLAG